MGGKAGAALEREPLEEENEEEWVVGSSTTVNVYAEAARPVLGRCCEGEDAICFLRLRRLG